MTQLTVTAVRDQLVADYDIRERRTSDIVKRRFAPMIAFFEVELGLRAIKIEEHHVRTYIQRRLAVASRSTIRQELTLLRRGMRVAGLAPPDFPRFEVGDNVRRAFISDDVFRCILRAMPQHFRAYLLFRYWCGWRTAETLGLTWNQTDLVKGASWLLPRETKTREPRIFPWGQIPELADAMRLQRERVARMELELAKKIPWVFPSKRGKRAARWPLELAWKKACEACGVTAGKKGGIITHDFRQTAAKNLTNLGIPVPVIIRIIGWKDQEMYYRYFKGAIVERDVEDALARAAEVFASGGLESNVAPLKGKETKEA